MAAPNFDLNLVRVFVAIYQEKSLTRTGERLNLTQSAISHALSRLRLALGDRLFERRGARMLPTAMARDVFPGLESGLRRMEAVLADGGRFDPAVSRRIFRLGMNDYSTSILLPRLMARLRREAPGLRLRIRHPNDTGLVDGIPAYFIETLQVEAQTPGGAPELARIDSLEPVSENPVYSLDVRPPPDATALVLRGRDNQGGEIRATIPMPPPGARPAMRPAMSLKPADQPWSVGQ